MFEKRKMCSCSSLPKNIANKGFWGTAYLSEILHVHEKTVKTYCCLQGIQIFEMIWDGFFLQDDKCTVRGSKAEPPTLCVLEYLFGFLSPTKKLDQEIGVDECDYDEDGGDEDEDEDDDDDDDDEKDDNNKKKKG